jgi:hypothetical protein
MGAEAARAGESAFDRAERAFCDEGRIMMRRGGELGVVIFKRVSGDS